MAVITVLTALTQSIPAVDFGWYVDGDFICGSHWLGRNPVWVVRFEEDVAWVQNVHPSILERESIPVWEEQDWSW